MIVTQEFVKKLTQLGLNSYEAKLWTALLSRGVSTAGELSDIANVPRSRSYDVLESLEKKGFIIQKLGKPIKYVALPPSEVLERVKTSIKEQAQAQSRQLDNLKGSEILEQLTVLHTQGIDMVEPTEITGALRSRNSIHDQVGLLIKEAEEEILIVSSSDGLRRKVRALERDLERAAKRGVSINAIVDKEPDFKVDYINVHVRSNLQARFVIADKKQVVFMLLPDADVHPSYDVGVWLNTPYVANALAQLFEMAFPVLQQ